jgi:protein-disulfide isomerase
MNGSSTMSKHRRVKNANKVARSTIAQERRRNIILASVLGGSILLVAGLIGFAIYQTQKPKAYHTPAHATADASGIVAAGTGRVRVDLYVDYQCPVCKGFDNAASTSLDQMVTKDQITLVYHPVAFLDRMSSTQYSTRAASASGCAADLSHFLEFTRVLYGKQPPENSAGLSDDQIIQVAGQAGIIDPKFATCVRDETYKNWVAHVTDSAAGKKVVGTPTVLVDNVAISPAGAAPTVDELTTAVNDALASATN